MKEATAIEDIAQNIAATILLMKLDDQGVALRAATKLIADAIVDQCAGADELTRHYRKRAEKAESALVPVITTATEDT